MIFRSPKFNIFTEKLLTDEKGMGQKQMVKVRYENEDTIMEFNYPDVTSQLAKRIDAYRVHKDSILLERIKEESQNVTRDIEIEGDSKSFKRFCYLICNLIDDKKGEIYCKACDRTYKADQIIKECVSPFDRRISNKTYKGIKKFFKKEYGIKGRIHISGSGGNTYLCPNRHELLYVRTWIS